jgi:hypothetical protein
MAYTLGSQKITKSNISTSANFASAIVFWMGAGGKILYSEGLATVTARPTVLYCSPGNKWVKYQPASLCMVWTWMGDHPVYTTTWPTHS